MINRENVIKAIECCYDQQSRCENCPYNDQMNCRDSAVIDALELLKLEWPKEDQPKTVLYMAERSIIPGKVLSGFCPKCGHTLVYDVNKHFCGNCGQEEKWK